MGSLKNLDGLLQDTLKRGPGGAGLRVYQGENLLYENYVGYASKEKNIPFTDRTICQLASMTKPIASAACMQLFEQGKFLLTDFVEDYYPEWKDRRIFSYSPRGDLRVIPAKIKPTVGHLFDMTSGVTVDWGWKNPNSEALAERMNEAKKKGEYTLQTFARAAGEIPGAFEAGEHYYYGQSLDVAAALLELLSGQTLGEYLKAHIFDPLGMEDTCFRVPEEKKPRISVQYQVAPDGVREGDFPPLFYDPTYESACGGLFGTMEDYSRFALAMTLGEYRGVRLLNDSTIRLMAMNRLSPQALADFENPYLSGYGYGLAVRTRMRPEAGSNSSIGEFGWTGGWGSWVLMDPAKKITIVYAHQCVPNQEEYVHPRIRNIVYGAL
ncbi:MAG: serine hydrolase [Oscillospiraceae bacterium]|nr:serine hydrolase [Oscillospiraceae bacterium]